MLSIWLFPMKPDCSVKTSIPVSQQSSLRRTCRFLRPYELSTLQVSPQARPDHFLHGQRTKQTDSLRFIRYFRHISPYQRRYHLGCIGRSSARSTRSMSESLVLQSRLALLVIAFVALPTGLSGLHSPLKLVSGAGVLGKQHHQTSNIVYIYMYKIIPLNCAPYS